MKSTSVAARISEMLVFELTIFWISPPRVAKIQACSTSITRVANTKSQGSNVTWVPVPFVTVLRGRNTKMLARSWISHCDHRNAVDSHCSATQMNGIGFSSVEWIQRSQEFETST